MRVPVYERRVPLAPLPSARVVPAMPKNNSGANIGNAVSQLAQHMIKLQEDTEDAHTLELFNKFKAESMEYHENPEKGIYNTRLGGNAQGVYSESDNWLRKTGENYVKELKSERSKKNFRNMAENYIQQRGLQNSKFEAKQVKKYQTEQADASYKLALDSIISNPYDENIVNQARQEMENATELKTRWDSPEAQKLAFSNIDNDIAVSRLNQMLIDNPLKAEKWFNENRSLFSGETLRKAETAVKNKTQSYQIQYIADTLINQFPQGREQEGLDWIRKHYSGELEQKIVSAYKSRTNEQEILQNRQEHRIREEQNNLEEEYTKQYYLYGILPTDTQFREHIVNNELRTEQVERLQNRQNVGAIRSKIEKSILASPGGGNLTRLELDQAVMSKMGITNEEYRQTFSAISDAIMQGNMTDSELDYYYQRGRITQNDVDRFKKQNKAIDEAQRDFYKSEMQDINASLKDLEKLGLSPEISQAVRINFTDAARSIEPEKKGKDYRQQLLEVKKKALLDGMEQSQISRTSWFGLSSSKFGDIYREIQDQNLANRGIDPFPLIPEIQPSKINLTNNTSRSSNTIGNLNFKAMFGSTHITSGYTGNRVIKGVRGTHYAIDFKAPEGTKIYTPDASGIQWTITKTGENNRAGKFITFSTVLDNGDTVELTYAHLSQIDVNKGDIVTPKYNIGLSGKTGNVTGPHVHLSAKLNGKTVDPRTIKLITKSDITAQPKKIKQDNKTEKISSLEDIFFEIFKGN